MLALLRVIKFALQDIGRNISLSFMTVLILVLMLLSVNTLIIVRAMTDEAVQTIKDQIDVSVYFHHDASDKAIEEVRSYVKSFPEVTGVEFFDRDQVLAQFKEKHKSNPAILASLDELSENPLGPTMIVKTREPQDYQKIITALSIPEYANTIEAKTFGDTERAIGRIDTITKSVEKFVLVLSGLFVLIAFFVIFNTIRVAIYTQRTEISIKKLVGASNWFIRSPYIIESIIFSAISVAASYVGVIFGIRFIEPYLGVVFGTGTFLTDYYVSHILMLAGLQFGAVLFLTIVTSAIAMRRYLRA